MLPVSYHLFWGCVMQVDRRLVLGLAASGAAGAAFGSPGSEDPTEIIRLWPGRPPGAPPSLPSLELVDRYKTSGFQDRYVTGIAEPLMTVFRPSTPNGSALIIAPGGGYIRVVIDKEGFEVGRRMARAGITCFVLRYRLPAEGWRQGAEVPLQDAQRAIRLVRARAGEFSLDPSRICFMGFSAGGHLAATLATGHDRVVYPAEDKADQGSARPDFSALMYPVIEMARPFAHAGSREALIGAAPTPDMEVMYSPNRHVGPATPPTFMIHAWDDPAVPVENTLNYLSALRAARRSCEAHLFEEGGHGFGIRLAQGKPASAWPDLFLAWAGRNSFLGKGQP